MLRVLRHRRRHLLVAGSALASAALIAGLVFAQPAPPPEPAPPVETAPPADLAAPPPTAEPPQEEAPPAVVEALPPEPAPPLESEKAEPAPEETKQAEEEKAPEPPPAKRIRHNVAILQALDKITAETLRFEAQVGKPVRYKNLVFTVRACERSSPEESMEDSIAYLVIESQPKAAPGRSTPPARTAFRGWMYASSPGLNPLEHPVYDAWVITCRAPAPAQVAAAPKSASTASAPAKRR